MYDSLYDKGSVSVEVTYSVKKTSDFRLGLQAGLSIAIGYMPVALTFGLLARTTGLTFAETVLMSVFVYAGAAQYISLSLIAVGTGVVEIVLTTLIVNIRHFLMSASLTERLEEHQLYKKLMTAFGVTDETFSVISTQAGKTRTAFAAGVMIISYGSWVVFSGVGHLMGDVMPGFLQVSMSIALYAMFVGLLVPSMKKNVKVAYLAAVAAAVNSLLIFYTDLSGGWSIVASTLVSSLLVEWVWQMKRRNHRG